MDQDHDNFDLENRSTVPPTPPYRPSFRRLLPFAIETLLTVAELPRIGGVDSTATVALSGRSDRGPLVVRFRRSVYNRSASDERGIGCLSLYFIVIAPLTIVCSCVDVNVRHAHIVMDGQGDGILVLGILDGLLGGTACMSNGLANTCWRFCREATSAILVPFGDYGAAREDHL